MRMAASMADTLGTSIQGVTEGVGVHGRKGAEATGGTANGIGNAIGGLFGAQKNQAAPYFLLAALATASIKPAARGFVTWRWIRIPVGVTSFP